MRNPKRAICYLVLLFAAAFAGKVGAEDAATLKQTDVFVGGADGYPTYRIPALLVSKKGTLLAFCEGRKDGRADSGDIDLLLKRSADNGATWSRPLTIWNDGTNTCGNPCAVLDEETGVIWLLMTHNDGRDTESAIKAKKGFGTRTVWVSRSNDDGETWSKPEEITKSVKDPSWGWYATGPGVGIQIKHGPRRGRLVIPCDHTYDEPGGNLRGLPVEYGSHVVYSDDHGRTWKLGRAIRPKVNECQVVELADEKGALLLDMRAYFGKGRRARSISRDGGETWSAPGDQAELIEPVCQASILRYTWPDEHGRGGILFANPADEKRRRNLTVRLSYDDGQTWPMSRTIHAKDSAYLCLTVLPDMEIACLYERGEQHANERITFARFSLEWLTEGKDSLKRK